MTTKKNQVKRPGRPLQRLVKRLRCTDCGHLKTEHIKDSICGTYVLEKVMLNVCIRCKRNTCEDIEDELCDECFNFPIRAA